MSQNKSTLCIFLATTVSLTACSMVTAPEQEKIKQKNEMLQTKQDIEAPQDNISGRVSTETLANKSIKISVSSNAPKEINTESFSDEQVRGVFGRLHAGSLPEQGDNIIFSRGSLQIKFLPSQYFTDDKLEISRDGTTKIIPLYYNQQNLEEIQIKTCGKIGCEIPKNIDTATLSLSVVTDIVSVSPSNNTVELRISTNEIESFVLIDEKTGKPLANYTPEELGDHGPISDWTSSGDYYFFDSTNSSGALSMRRSYDLTRQDTFFLKNIAQKQGYDIDFSSVTGALVENGYIYVTPISFYQNKLNQIEPDETEYIAIFDLKKSSLIYLKKLSNLK